MADPSSFELLTKENFEKWLLSYDLKFEKEKMEEVWNILKDNFGKKIKKVQIDEDLNELNIPTEIKDFLKKWSKSGEKRKNEEIPQINENLNNPPTLRNESSFQKLNQNSDNISYLSNKKNLESSSNSNSIQNKNEITSLTIDPTLSSNNIPISGFYKLISIQNDEQNENLVEKVLIERIEITRFCNDLVPNSCRNDGSNILFNLLNSISSPIYGFYGINELIPKCLIQLGLLNETQLPYFEKLNPGIYALVLSKNNNIKDRAIVLIFWSENNSYGENEINSNSIKLIAFLKSLSHHIFCCIDSKMIDQLEVQAKPKENRKAKYRMEAKSIQEDSIELIAGFEVNISNDLNVNFNTNYINPSLGTYYGIATRELLPEEKNQVPYEKTFKTPQTFKTEIENFKANYNLYFDLSEEKMDNFCTLYFKEKYTDKLKQVKSDLEKEKHETFKKQKEEYDKNMKNIEEALQKSFKVFVIETYSTFFEFANSQVEKKNKEKEEQENKKNANGEIEAEKSLTNEEKNEEKKNQNQEKKNQKQEKKNQNENQGKDSTQIKQNLFNIYKELNNFKEKSDINIWNIYKNYPIWKDQKLDFKWINGYYHSYLCAKGYLEKFSCIENKNKFIQKVVKNKWDIEKIANEYSKYSKYIPSPFGYPEADEVKSKLNEYFQEIRSPFPLPFEKEEHLYLIFDQFHKFITSGKDKIIELSKSNDYSARMYGVEPKESNFNLEMDKKLSEQKKIIFDTLRKEEFPIKEGYLQLRIQDFPSTTSHHPEISIKLKYSQELILQPRYKYTFYPLILKKSDIEDLEENPNINIKPILHKSGIFEIDSKEKVNRSYVMTNQRLFYISNLENNKSKIQIYNMQQNKSLFFKEFNEKTIKLTVFDEKSRLLTVYYQSETNKHSLNSFRFNEKFTYLDNIGQIDLNIFSINTELKEMHFIPIKNQVLLLDKSNNIRIYDINRKTVLKEELNLNNSLNSSNLNLESINESKDINPMDLETNNFILVSRRGECLFNCFIDKVKSNLIMESYLFSTMKPVPNGTFSIPLNNTAYSKNHFSIVEYGNSNSFQQHLQIYDPTNLSIISYRLQIKTKEEGIGIQKENQNQNQNQNLSESRKKIYTPLDYIFFVFDKFSTENLIEGINSRLIMNVIYETFKLDLSTVKSRIQNKMREIIKELEKTEKPIDNLELKSNIETIPLDQFSINFINQTQSINHYIHKFNYSIPLGQFIKILICLVPLQITRAENNEFFILSDGFLVPLESNQNSLDLSFKIKLGLYDSILSIWDGPIKVISSMGKQSTGKSYTLNHLTGSFFEISGKRCTDGCWMTIRETKGCLYIILDFEGLGSIERTTQEDMLLSVMNAAISNLTLFKTEFRFDRDIEQMFSKFQSGVDLIKGDDKLFGGEFCIVIKDVDDRDVKSLHQEFQSKITRICNDNKENNFISKMYKEGFTIFPFPPLGKKEYYEELTSLKEELKKIKPQFNNGNVFKEFLTYLMAKISLQDWTSVDELKIRLHYLNQKLSLAITYGKLNSNDNELFQEDLKCMDNSKLIEDLPIMLKLNNDNQIEIDLLDSKIILNSENVNFDSLIEYFEMKLISRNGENFKEWEDYFCQFLESIIERRINRVKNWIELNTLKWKDNVDIIQLKHFVENELIKLTNKRKLCANKCNECYLSCLKPHNHEEQTHDCKGIHNCEFNCSFCSEEIKCGYKRGHNNKHNCNSKSHTCGQECILSKYGNCNKICALEPGHEGIHKCNSSIHYCHKKCSLPSCTFKCIIREEKKHEIHKCNETKCVEKCCIDECSNSCEVKDHFHGHKELSKKYAEENPTLGKPLDSKEHFCPREHSCPKDCEKKGFCEVSYALERTRIENFYGRRDKFEYQYSSEGKGTKKKCGIRIPPKQKSHDGQHHCGTTTTEEKFHYCDVKCSSCEYICEKEYGHSGLHKTSHGNMRNTYFISDKQDIDIGDRKYVIGEPGKAELCNLFCRNLSRGHIHILPCDSSNPNQCTHSSKDGRRHQTLNYEPNKDIPKDELTHEKYWEVMGFEDPYSQEDKDLFKKCPYQCFGDHQDENGNEKPSFCTENIWHDLLDPNSKPTKGGTISKDGHHYSCTHSSKNHIIFCLDDSGSMKGQPWNDLYEAVKKFIETRRQLSKEDIFSIIIYNSSARIECEQIQITQPFEKYLTFKGGDTNFSKALKKSYEVISRTNFKLYIPTLLFLSDGRDKTGGEEMGKLAKDFLKHGLQVYTIGFAKDSFFKSDFNKLEQLADLGKGTFCQSEDGIKLSETFLEISSKLGQVISLATQQT